MVEGKTNKSLDVQLTEIEGELRRLEAEKIKLYKASLKAHTDDKLVDDAMASFLLRHHEEMIRQRNDPVQVRRVHFDNEPRPFRPSWRDADGKKITWVSIKPIVDNPEKKTYLGILIGDVALGVTTKYAPDGEVLHVSLGHYNPAIFVPDLGRVVLGAESWWGEVKGPDDLKEITDDDIQNVWYVKALSELQASTKTSTPPTTPTVALKPDQLKDMLALAGTDVDLEVIGGWSEEQRATASSWAAATHVKIAYPDTKVPERPEHVPKPR